MHKIVNNVSMENVKIDFTKEQKDNLSDSTMYFRNKDGEIVEAYGIDDIINNIES